MTLSFFTINEIGCGCNVWIDPAGPNDATQWEIEQDGGDKDEIVEVEES